jgi:small subunit ribosomal protein S2
MSQFFRKLAEAGVHFGHETSRWCPKMSPYIWGTKNHVHLIDVSKTEDQLKRAAKFLESVAAQGEQILWVGTKKAAQDVIVNTAKSLNMPYVSQRWVGGTLSNFPQVKKSVTKLLHYEDIIAKAEKFPHYTKKDIAIFQKIVIRLKKIVDGIRNLVWPIGAIVLVDVSKERSALKEAVKMGIPVVAIVDTNGDPSLVDYVIPGNDDTPKSIKILIDYLAEAATKGKEAAGSKKVTKSAGQSASVDRAETATEVMRITVAEQEEEINRKKKKVAGGAKSSKSAKEIIETDVFEEEAEVSSEKKPTE